MFRYILVVDDDSDDRELIVEALGEITGDIKCLMAANGRKAVAKLLEISIPDLIIMDINMPIMDGWECLRLLKLDDNWKKIPVIMYSTSSHKEDLVKAKRNGALCFFTKPFDFKGLKKCLEIIVRHLDTGNLSCLQSETFLF